MSARKLILNDVTLRDGMHALAHQYTVEQMVAIARKLDEAKVDLIEVSHGDGLNGNSFNYGFSAATEPEYLEAVGAALTHAKLVALLLPGIGTREDLKMARSLGVHTIRVATHCTEADISRQHIELARELGMDTVGFLMMAHMLDPEALARQAKILEDFGAEIVYCTDSAGAMLPDDVTARIGALRAHLRPETAIGFHGHHNLAMGVANSLAAMAAGAARIDASCAGLGAGAGNTPTEVLVAVLQRMGVSTGIDLDGVMDVAEDLIVPLMKQPVRIDRDALTLGYAGVYSSFLLFAKRAAARYGLRSRDLLVEMGRLKTVGGQEDLIEAVALDMAMGGRPPG